MNILHFWVCFKNIIFNSFKYLMVWLDHNLFNYSSIDVECFQFFTIVNVAVMNTLVWESVSFWLG